MQLKFDKVSLHSRVVQNCSQPSKILLVTNWNDLSLKTSGTPLFETLMGQGVKKKG